jgi:hypothetical protein
VLDDEVDVCTSSDRRITMSKIVAWYRQRRIYRAEATLV